MSNCRFYESKLPEVDDVVMVRIVRIAEVGAYVALEEYNDTEGVILMKELSKRRIRSVQKLVRIGRREAAVVQRVDKEKSYIDLSKSKVTTEEAVQCNDKYQKSKMVHTVITHVAKKVGMEPEALYEKVGWPLYRKYGHAYDAFKMAVADPEAVFGEFALDRPLYDELMTNISRRLTPQKVKLRADLEIQCYGPEGVEAVRRAIKAAESVSTEETPIKIRLIAPPTYVMSTTSLNKTEDIELMERAIEAAKKAIEAEQDGKLTVVMKPKLVSEYDERELQDLMERAERENADVSGDDSEDLE
ncbi:hypothetical protein H4S06_002888 [Coemansia sp. BCRC 34490]|nr:hypothetical protein LPJ72_001101 [Coemansia sp. Benny D160-2]KAJ2508136.1 hypothetical protein GGI11_006165 [Coemansia sp. RSA 2049]KAJ2518657.1 hypothetical protein H4217_003194 [Coemansia sp. RSA 1939]KAJ2607954.1 hypothetical protein EV177_005236 [Coemansia sp. RSA 1804]KAJ2689171.1 hypothetical protein GGH99_002885 [Coemansia sp. RSA 1285]KAJ2758041.1 hypothetical protein H4S06_002888 [Coemansia sp. BCRC 34490]